MIPTSNIVQRQARSQSIFIMVHRTADRTQLVLIVARALSDCTWSIAERIRVIAFVPGLSRRAQCLADRIRNIPVKESKYTQPLMRCARPEEQVQLGCRPRG